MMIVINEYIIYALNSFFTLKYSMKFDRFKEKITLMILNCNMDSHFTFKHSVEEAIITTAIFLIKQVPLHISLILFFPKGKWIFFIMTFINF